MMDFTAGSAANWAAVKDFGEGSVRMGMGPGRLAGCFGYIDIVVQTLRLW